MRHRNPTTSALPVAVLALVLALPMVAGCGGTDTGSADDGRADRDASAETAAEATAEATADAEQEQQPAETTADEGTAQSGGRGEGAAGGDAAQSSVSVTSGGSGGAERAVLKLRGTPGTRFTGECSVGERAKKLRGETPARYVYDLRGGALECSVTNGDGGTLTVDLRAAGGGSSQSQVVRLTGGGTVTVRLSG